MECSKCFVIIILITPVLTNFYSNIDNTRENFDNIRHVILFTFHNFSCIAVFTGNYQFDDEFYKALYSTNIPIVLHEHKQYCHGYAVVVKDIISAVTVIKDFKKFYTHRILCYIFDRAPHFKQYLEMNKEAFGEAETLIVNGNNTYIYNPGLKKLSSQNFTFNAADHLGKYVPTYNFQGREIVVGAFNLSVFTTIGPLDSFGKPKWFKGIEISSFAIIAALMNVTWHLNIPDLNQNWWGIFFPNGTVAGGVLGTLAEKRADLVMGCLWTTLRSYTYFDFSPPRKQVCLRNLVRRPRHLNTEWSSIWRPFPVSVWLLVLVMAFINTIAVTAITYIKNKIDKSFAYKDCVRLWNSNFLSFSILLQAGIPQSNEKQGPLRHIINWWVVTSFLVTSSFTSSLVSHITTPDMEHRPETIKDLVKDGYFWGTIHPPTTEHVFDVNIPWYKEWARRCIEMKTVEQHLRILHHDKYILWGKSIENSGFHLNEDYLPLDELKNWEISDEIILRFYFAFFLRKGSALLPAVNRYTSRLFETGHIDKLIKELLVIEGESYMTQVFDKTKPTSVGPSTLTLRNLQGVFYFYILGLISALFSFILETLLKRKGKVQYLFFKKIK